MRRSSCRRHVLAADDVQRHVGAPLMRGRPASSTDARQARTSSTTSSGRSQTMQLGVRGEGHDGVGRRLRSTRIRSGLR